MNSDIDFYSIYCNEYEKCDFFGEDILSEVRRQFFKDKKKYKNRIDKKMYGVMYHYMYCIQDGQPMKWKKVVEGKIREKSVLRNNSYEIVYQDSENKVFKISEFDFYHDWIQTKYYSKLHKPDPVMTISPHSNDGSLKIKEFNLGNNKIEEYFISPYKIVNESDVIKSIPKIICNTSIGELLFFKENLEGESVDSDKLMGILYEEKKTDFMDDKKNTEENVLEEYVYFGDLKNEKKHGHGRLISVNGRTVFEGNFFNEKKFGYGVSFYKNGEVSFAGHFEDGLKHGIGISFKQDGKLIHVGKWLDDLPCKKCSIFDSDGNLLFTGNIIDGKRDGLCSLYDIKGERVLIGMWNDGTFSGKGTIFNSGGEIELSGDIDEETIKSFI